MASAVTTSKLFSEMKIQMFDHDPGATTAIITSPDGGTTKRVADMRDYEYFGVLAALTVIGSSSGITKVEIVAATDSAITTPVVVKDSGTVDADAIGDYVALECTVEELAALGSGLRYLAARITCSHAGDEACVTYIQGGARRATNGLTATTIA